MSRIALVVATLVLLLVPVRSQAAFHLAQINEVRAQVGADATAQSVEIRLLAGGQTFVTNTRLTAFNCNGTTVNVLYLVPHDIPFLCAAPMSWTMATASWATATGVTPDFTFPGGIFPTCGQICWGAPGSIVPPPTWDATDPNNYTDCVAYGAYTGPTQLGFVAPTPLDPANATMSLQRTANTGNDSADFALAAPTPETTAACPTTSTVTTSTTSTSSTIPPTAVDQLLSGKKLLIKNPPLGTTNNKAVHLAKDPAVATGAAGSNGDPQCSGFGGGGTSSLRILASGGAGDVTIPLPCAGWTTNGANNLYKYKDTSGATCRIVLVKNGVLVKAVCKGSQVAIDLNGAMAPVAVVTTLNAQKYCTSFGGATVVKDGSDDKTFLHKAAPAPGACPP